ncbi:hypothetical protein HKD28_11725 [Gluconobacter sp. LMG 1744]|uniref:hypothetical protein n=1 Tax=Gluconobacter cadivus TaxID=2728101 RepID=UPI0018856252|nr:hypothetical protein [Gluconobacter cadivus]MBF0892070.1 hypothetical protein [Gluconobacter cadivus]
MQFDFSNLRNIYNQAIQNHHPTIAFRLVNGQGIFVFMMFFSEEDESKDTLFILLGRTQVLLRLKMYGNHQAGTFTIYTKSYDDSKILEELNIREGNIPYDQRVLFENLNQNIPQNLPFADSIGEVRNNANVVSKIDGIIDDNDRIYLIGTRRLPPTHTPKEKTLRKLYLYVNAPPNIIEIFTDHLRHNNMTLAWSNDPTRANNNINAMM